MVMQPELTGKITCLGLQPGWARYGSNITPLKPYMLEQWHWTRTEMNVTCIKNSSAHGLSEGRLAVTDHGLAGAMERWDGRKSAFLHIVVNWHPCKSDRFWKRGQEGLIGPWATCILLLSRPSCYFSGDPALITVHKTKNCDLTWEHRGETQCLLAGFMGCRENFSARRAAQWVKAFHLWELTGEHRVKQGLHPLRRIPGITNSPWISAPPTAPSDTKQNRQECARHKLHQHREFCKHILGRKKNLISDSLSSYRLGKWNFQILLEDFEKNHLNVFVNDRKLFVFQVGDSHVVFYLLISKTLLKIDHA